MKVAVEIHRPVSDLKDDNDFLQPQTSLPTFLSQSSLAYLGNVSHRYTKPFGSLGSGGHAGTRCRAHGSDCFSRRTRLPRMCGGATVHLHAYTCSSCTARARQSVSRLLFIVACDLQIMDILDCACIAS